LVRSNLMSIKQSLDPARERFMAFDGVQNVYKGSYDLHVLLINGCCCCDVYADRLVCKAEGFAKRPR